MTRKDVLSEVVLVQVVQVQVVQVQVVQVQVVHTVNDQQPTSIARSRATTLRQSLEPA
jgi:hypothetical protein